MVIEPQSPSRTIPGNASSSTVREQLVIKAEGSTRIEEPRTPVTRATATADIAFSPKLPRSSSSVPDTTKSGWLSTDSTATPIHYLDEGLPPLTEADFLELSTDLLLKLTVWAEARGESRQDAINTIVQFLVEENDERSGYTMHDAITFFLTNYVS